MIEKEVFRSAQRQLSVTFVVVLIAGAALTFVNKWFPFFAVLIYAGIGGYLSKEQKNTERFADSLYYLGFLLTLFSLFAATLNETDATSSIISNLGTGLSTTLTGLALRVIVLQFRDTVSDQEEEAKESLDLAVQRMVEHFDHLNGKVSGLTERLDAIDKVSIDALGRLSVAVGTAEKGVARIPSEATALVLPAAEQMAARIRAVEVPPDLVFGQIRRLFSELAAASTSAQRSIEHAAGELREEFRATGEAASSARIAVVETLASLSMALAQMRDEVPQLLTASVENVGEMTTELQRKISRVDFAPLSSLNAEVRNLTQASAENVQKISAAAGQLAALHERHARSAAEFEASVRKSVEAVDQLSAASRVVTAIEQVCSELGARVSQLNGVVSGVGDSSGMLIRTVEDVAKDIGQVKTAAETLITYVGRQQ